MNGKFALVVALAAGTALAPVGADAALLSLTDGTPFKTSSKNDVVESGTTLLDNATLSTTQNNVKLTFHFLGSESGFKNTLNVGGEKHTEADKYPASWSESSVVGPVTQASAGPVDMFFTSSGFSGELEPGQGDISKSIAFAYLAEDENTVLFALDDGGRKAGKKGSKTDHDYDDYVGYIVAAPLTSAPVSEAPPLTPTPVPAALPMFVTAMVGLGLIGRRRKKATA
jgi:hypothetical protein